jgi:hypothetical protein
MHQPQSNNRPKPGSYALVLFPCLLIIVFLMHFRQAADFFHFKLIYVQPDPTRIVTMLVRAQNHWSMFRDPHVLAYLGLPLLPVCGFTLFKLSRESRPRLSGLALFITVSGSIYLGGLFGMWTAFYRGLGEVDPSHLDGAVATFRGMTAPQGAFLLTTNLAKLALIGLAAQSFVMWGLPGIPRRSVILIALGCLTIVAFWDLDNWMLIGTMIMMIGFLPLIPLVNKLESSTKA